MQTERALDKGLAPASGGGSEIPLGAVGRVRTSRRSGRSILRGIDPYMIFGAKTMREAKKVTLEDRRAVYKEAQRRFPDDISSQLDFIENFIRVNTGSTRWAMWKLGLETAQAPFGCKYGLDYPEPEILKKIRELPLNATENTTREIETEAVEPVEVKTEVDPTQEEIE